MDSAASDDQRLANRLGALALHVTNQITAAATTAAGRGAAAPAALTALSRNRRRPIDYLRRILGLSHPAAVRVVDRLTDDGLVRRVRGTDRRSVTPVLTTAGRAAAGRVAVARLDVLTELVSGLPADDRAHLARILERLLHAAADTEDDAIHLCRLCDLPTCERRGPCPVDAGLDARQASTTAPEAKT